MSEKRVCWGLAGFLLRMCLGHLSFTLECCAGGWRGACALCLGLSGGGWAACVFVNVPPRASGHLTECPWGRGCGPPPPFLSVRGPVLAPRRAAASHLVCPSLCSSVSVFSASVSVGAHLDPSVPVDTLASVPPWDGRPCVCRDVHSANEGPRLLWNRHIAP